MHSAIALCFQPMQFIVKKQLSYFSGAKARLLSLDSPEIYYLPNSSLVVCEGQKCEP
jgi:hypothetical protein